MKLTVTRSGGILGVPTSYQIDTDRLADDQVKHVNALIDSAPPHASTSETPGADLFQYDVAEDGAPSHHWVFHGEGNAGSALFTIAQTAGEKTP